MPVDIYEQALCEPLFHREKRQPFTKNRQAELQASYYQRRGWFKNKKRMLFKRIGLEAKLYSHIESMTELDAFAKQFLMDNYQLDIPVRPTIFFNEMCKTSTFKKGRTKRTKRGGGKCSTLKVWFRPHTTDFKRQSFFTSFNLNNFKNLF